MGIAWFGRLYELFAIDLAIRVWRFAAVVPYMSDCFPMGMFQFR